MLRCDVLGTFSEICFIISNYTVYFTIYSLTRNVLSASVNKIISFIDSYLPYLRLIYVNCPFT